MKIRSTIGLMLAIMLTAVLGFGTAQAAIISDCGETYVVKKNDSLSKIGKKCRASLKELCAANPEIKNKNLIHPDQKIKMPEESTLFRYQNPGYEKYTGNLDEALKLLDYSKKQAEALKQAVKNGQGYADIIKNGDKFAMVFGVGKVRHNTVADFKKRDSIWAMTYKVQVDGKELTLKFSLECNNWARYPEITIVKKEIAIPEKPVKKVEPPSTPAEPVKVVEVTKVPEVIKIEKVVKKREKIKCRDIELNVATGYLFGEKADMRDLWYYAEGMYWDTCWEWSRGIGFYLNGDLGEVNSGYEWNSFGVGPQFGLRYQNYAKDDDGRVYPYGVTAKLRLIWTKMHGENSSGYEMTQHDLLVGLYVEYIRQIKEGLHWGVTFETWLSVWSEIDSSWAGDSPSDRARVFIGAFIQKRLSEDFAVRLGAGVGYQAWDEKYLIGVFGELRYREWLMCGVAANFVIEDGIVWGPYCRAEFGNLVRSDRDKKIITQIVAIDDKGNPIEDAGEEKVDQSVNIDNNKNPGGEPVTKTIKGPKESPVETQDR